MCAAIEDEYSVTIDLVVVGDLETRPELDPVVQALREAAVNAAKHAGVATFDAYLEVGAREITAFVRDRGHGYDAAEVPADRHGVRESIIGRMQRAGGEATIRSSAAGTEVRLRFPLRQEART
jgi:signal transduction histidine kinase